jgi:hypothetical protein
VGNEHAIKIRGAKVTQDQLVELGRLVVAQRDAKQLVDNWMDEMGRQARLVTASMSPLWPHYESAVAALKSALDAVPEQIGGDKELREACETVRRALHAPTKAIAEGAEPDPFDEAVVRVLDGAVGCYLHHANKRRERR